MARYYSKYASFTANVLKERIPRHPVTGDLMFDQQVKAVRAEFGEFGPEVDVPLPGTDFDDDGRPIHSMKGAVIRGHYFDSIEAQKQNQWTDEEREAVERRLDWLCENIPDFVSHVEAAKVPAPWPTYDTTHHNSIAGLAEQLGLLNEAQLYEIQNKNRDTVNLQLQEKLESAQAEQELTAASA